MTLNEIQRLIKPQKTLDIKKSILTIDQFKNIYIGNIAG